MYEVGSSSTNFRLSSETELSLKDLPLLSANVKFGERLKLGFSLAITVSQLCKIDNRC